MDSPINFLDLPKGVDVNFQDNLGNTILHTTVKNNDLTTTRYLRHYNANFNIQNLLNIITIKLENNILVVNNHKREFNT